MIKSRTCKDCGKTLPETVEFFNKKGDGFHARCKPCRSELRKRAYPSEKEALNASRRAARAQDTERFRAADRERYRADPTAKLRSVAAYRARNPEAVRASHAKYYAANREHRIELARQWAAKNPDKRRLAFRELYERRSSDPNFRLRRSMQAHMWYSLKARKAGQRWETLVGYTLEDLMQHMERQFQRGMTWENYGEWHVDHILPASSFQYESPEDEAFKACWALTNLRPMWASENISKGAKRLHLI